MPRLADDDEREAGEALVLKLGQKRAERGDRFVRVEAVEVQRDFSALFDGEGTLGAGEDGLGDDAETDAAAALVASGATVRGVVRRARATVVATEGVLDELLALLDNPVRRVSACRSGSG